MESSQQCVESLPEDPQIRIAKTPPQNFDYFIEGYDLPPTEQLIRNRLLNHMPTLKTKTYRDSLLKIVSSLSDLDNFTENLQSKVDKLLQAQQTTFVQSYKQHMDKIQSEFDKLHKLIDQLQQKIRYYQNQGQMSALVKKVFQLEQESSRLFKSMTDKDKKIRDLELTIAMQKRQMKILQETVKINAREKSLLLSKEIRDSEETPIKLEDVTVFATELGLPKKSSFMSQNSPNSKTPIRNVAHNTSLKSVTVDLQNQDSFSHNLSKSNQKSLREQLLYKQNYKLKLKNKKLLGYQAKVVDYQGQIQEFFVNCVEQLKKEIRVRKKMDYCTLEDFKKEDKLLLMIKILSNNEIISYLHQRIFHKPKNNDSHSTEAQLNTEERIQGKLPRINFNLSYHHK